MDWSHRIITPADPALILPTAAMKSHLDVTSADDDTMIAAYASSAIDWVQDQTNRFLGPTEVEYIFPFFPSVIQLPFAPVTSINSINYTNESGVSTLLVDSVYRASAGEPYRIYPAHEQDWPSISAHPESVVINATVGYSAAADIPTALIQAAKIVVGIFYDDPDERATKSAWDCAERLCFNKRFSF